MDIKMPEVNGKPLNASAMKRCTMYLATRCTYGKTVTLMRVEAEVVLFEPGCPVRYISPNSDEELDSSWIDANFTIVREYKKGDSLTLTV